MTEKDINEIKTLLKILYNYRVNFSKAISIHNKIAHELDQMPILFSENEEVVNRVVNSTMQTNLTILERTTKLNMVNSMLLKAGSVEELTNIMVKSNIFNLDKELLQTINKQQKLYYSCKEKGYVLSQVNNAFEMLNSSLNNMYSTIITQFKICEDYLNYSLSKQGKQNEEQKGRE